MALTSPIPVFALATVGIFTSQYHLPDVTPKLAKPYPLFALSAVKSLSQLP